MELIKMQLPGQSIKRACLGLKAFEVVSIDVNIFSSCSSLRIVGRLYKKPWPISNSAPNRAWWSTSMDTQMLWMRIINDGWTSKNVQPSNSHKFLVRLMMRQFCQLKTQNIVELFESLQPWIYRCFIADEGFCAWPLCKFHPKVPWSKLGVTLQCVLWPRTLACGSDLVSGQHRGIKKKASVQESCFLHPICTVCCVSPVS